MASCLLMFLYYKNMFKQIYFWFFFFFNYMIKVILHLKLSIAFDRVSSKFNKLRRRAKMRITLVSLQKSRSLQQDSSTTTSGPRLGSMYTAPIEDVNTTRLTLASAAAIITFLVPFTAGSTICSCNCFILYTLIKFSQPPMSFS